MKPNSTNRFLAALLAASGLLTAICFAGGTIVTNNTGISAASFSFVDDPAATIVSGAAGGDDGDANAYGNTAKWASSISVNYPFTGLSANTSYNVYATWKGGGSVGMTAKVGTTTVGTVNQGVEPSSAGSGFTAYDNVNDLPAEVRNFQLLGTATTDASGNLTVNASKAAGYSFVRWDCFAVAPGPTLTNYYWDGPSGIANGASDGGSGTWNTSATNWDTGTSVAWSNGSLSRANFGGTAGTVTVAETAITANGLVFATSGYTLSAANCVITAPISITTDGSLTLDTSDTLGIANPITGTGSTIIKSGTGTLTLSNSNGYSALTVDGGKVVAPNGAVPAAAIVTVNTGGTLSLTDASYIAVPGTLNIIGGTVSMDGATQNAHNYINKTLTMEGGTLTSVNGPAGPANDGGYGNFILNGSTLVVGGSAQSVISSTTFQINTGGGSLTVNDAVAGAGTDLLVSASITGSSTLIKNGPGTMELTGINTYTGNTTVNEGTLKVGATGSLGASPTLTVATGATLDLSATAGLTLTSSKTLAGGGTLIGAVTANGGKINVTGPLSIGTLNLTNFPTLNITPGAASLTITDTDGLNTGVTGNEIWVDVGTTPLTSGTYPLIQYQGTIQGEDGFSAFLLGITPGGDYTYDLIQNGNSIDLVVSPLAKLWTGALDSEWSTGFMGSPKNWKDGLNESDFVTGDDVLFDDSAGNTIVSINTTDVNPNSVLFSNNTKDYTLQGSAGITGATDLTKASPGTLIIDNTNSFTGFVNILGGTLTVASVADGGSNSTLGAGTEIAFDGGTLAYSGGTTGTNRTLYLDGDGTVEVTSPGSTLTLSGEITGGGSFNKAGDGILVPTFDNTYYGATRISGGTLNIVTLPDGGVPGPLGESSNAAGSLVLAGGTLNYSGTGETSDRGFTLAAETSSTIDVTDPNAVLALSGAVAGTGNLIKTGPGTFATSATGIVGGEWTVNAGTLSLTNASFGHVLGTLNIIGTTVSMDGTAQNAHNYISKTLTMEGGTLTSINGPAGPANDSGFGNFILNGSTLLVGGSAQSVINCTTFQCKNDGVSSFDVGVTGAGIDLLVNSALVPNGAYAGALYYGALLKNGLGTMKLTGRNTYTGDTTVNEGTLILADDARLTFAISNTNGASNKITGDGSVTLNGDFAINTSAVTSLTTGTWQLENVTSLTGAYGTSFTVMNPDGTPWTDAGSDKWTMTSGTRKWTFDETTGTLTLSVTAGFSSWIGGFGLALNDQDPTDDPDGDGVNNLIEYALAGRNPAVSDGPAGTFAGGLLSFAKRTDATGITYAIQESDDLGLGDDWATVAATTDTTSEITWQMLPADRAKRFARLQVSQTP